MKRLPALFCLTSVLTLFAATPLHAGDWHAWRGPSGNAVADGPAPPTSFGPNKNVIWKADVPGRGHSSPIIVGNRVILTTADDRAQVQSVVAFDRATGKQLWKTDVNRGGFPSKIHKKNTHASPTPASDGKRVFAVFNNHDSVQLTALSLDGEQLWQVKAGAYRPSKYQFGYAPSPLLHDGKIIVAAETENDSYLAAFDANSGKRVWLSPRPKSVSYSSPIVAKVAGREQLLITGLGQLAAYDPANGKPLWSVNAIAPATCGTVVWDGDVVFGSGGYPTKETVAVKADGSGKVVWRNSEKCYEQSMLAHKGYLYAFDDRGIARCWRVSDGEEMWSERLRGPVSASFTLAGGHLYTANERGTFYVIKADPEEFDLVEEIEMGDESFASPVIVDGQIFLRVADGRGPGRKETLYCIGTK